MDDMLYDHTVGDPKHEKILLIGGFWDKYDRYLDHLPEELFGKKAD